MVIETLEGWLSVLFALTGNFLTDRLDLDFLRRSCICFTMPWFAFFSSYLIPKLFHISRVGVLAKLDRSLA